MPHLAPYVSSSPFCYLLYFSFSLCVYSKANVQRVTALQVSGFVLLWMGASCRALFSTDVQVSCVPSHLVLEPKLAAYLVSNNQAQMNSDQQAIDLDSSLFVHAKTHHLARA